MPISGAAPTVSIVIPCYNPGRMLEGCLRSVLSQTYPRLQIILVDNGSTDASPELAGQLAARHQRPITLLSCARRGQNAAMLAGYAAVTGDYFQWMDADDRLDPRKIEAQVTALEKNRRFDVAYSDWRWEFCVPGQPRLQVTFQAQQYDDYLAQQLLGNWRPPICFMLKRAAADRLHALGAWEPDLSINTDRVFYTWAALIGLRFVHAPGLDAGVTYFTWNDQQITRQTGNQKRILHLQQFYRQLRQYIRQQDAIALSPLHRECLAETHRRCKPRPLRIVWEGNRSLAVPGDGSPPVPLTPVQERVLVCLQNQWEPVHFEHHARVVCQMLWRRASLRHRDARGQVDFPAACRQLESLVGLADQENGAWPEDRLGGEAGQVRLFLETGPLYVPIFARARLAIRRELAQLAALGLLRWIDVAEASESP